MTSKRLAAEYNHAAAADSYCISASGPYHEPTESSPQYLTKIRCNAMISADHAQPPYIAVRVHRIWKIRVQILALRLRSFLFLLGYLPLCFEGQRDATSTNLALVRYWLDSRTPKPCWQDWVQPYEAPTASALTQWSWNRQGELPTVQLLPDT